MFSINVQAQSYRSSNYQWKSSELVNPKTCTTIKSCGAAKDKMNAYLSRCKQPGAGCASHDVTNAGNSYWKYYDTEKKLKLEAVYRGKQWSVSDLEYKGCKTVAECDAKVRLMVDYWYQCKDKINDPQLESVRCKPEHMDKADYSRILYIRDREKLKSTKTEGSACANVRKIQKSMEECGERDDGICSGEALRLAQRDCDNQKNRKGFLSGVAAGAILMPKYRDTSSGRTSSPTKPAGQNK